jgi:thiamine biosynthesis protein ThiS
VQVIINGEAHDLEGPILLSELLERLNLKPGRIAIERNLELVPRANWASTTVSDGDRIEIVHFVGGG